MTFRIVLTYRVLILVLLAGCSTNGGVYHPVAEGQTLYRISRAYSMDEHYLARLNGITDPTRLRTGDRIFIPGATKIRQVAPPPIKSAPAAPAPSDTALTAKALPPASATAAASSAPPAGKSASKKPMPASKVPPPAAINPAKKPPGAPPPPSRNGVAPAPSTATAAPPAVAGRFLWPVRGPLLRRFGSSGGTSGKGLEIGVPVNTPVVAAAAGRVIYSGDGISSYGNLIIVKHDDTFFTVYGYNVRNLVSSGTFVSKGEKIALAGTPPDGGKSRLYFEVRYGKDAVDPTIYLP